MNSVAICHFAFLVFSAKHMSFDICAQYDAVCLAENIVIL